MKKTVFKFLVLLFFSMTWGLSFGQKTIIVGANETHIKNVDHIKYIGMREDSFRLKTNLQSSLDVNIIRRLDKIHHFKGINNKLVHSSDGKYFVCDSYDHGGYSNTLYFFNKEEVLLNTYTFDGHSRSSTGVDFNFCNTYFLVAEDNGNFYIFNPDGSLKRKANISELGLKNFGEVLTFDISKDGALIVLDVNNNGVLILNGNLEVLMKFNKGIVSSFISPDYPRIYLGYFTSMDIVDTEKYVVTKTIDFPEQVRITQNKLQVLSKLTITAKTYELQ
jgi:WD40 repeat protein